MLAAAAVSVGTAVPIPNIVGNEAGNAFCGVATNGGPPPMQNWQMTIACSDPGATLVAFPFASYGTPDTSGACGTWTSGACAAANTSAVVTGLCLGQAQCVVFPNTTTFGDPCFGTAKVLAVVAECSSGSGTVVASVAPAPVPTVPVAVQADFSAPTVTTITSPTLQVRVHVCPLLKRTLPPPECDLTPSGNCRHVTLMRRW